LKEEASRGTSVAQQPSRGEAKPVKAYRGQRGKSVEERLVFGLGHRIRLRILVLLNEGTYCLEEIAQIISEPRDIVKHHLKELRGAGAIELAEVVPTRYTQKHYYRAIQMPEYSAEELAGMALEERQAVIGVAIQHMTAEVLASFWAGKMAGDPENLWLGWRWLNLDTQGRKELAEEQMRWWRRALEIEAESTNRRAKSGEEVQPMVLAMLGFLRERTAPVSPPASSFDER